MMFGPNGPSNYAKKNIKQSGYEFNETTEEDILYFTVKSKEPIKENNPQCEFNMPPLNDFFEIKNVRNISENQYELNIKINISKTTCIEMVYIYFFCDTCVQKMNDKIANERNYKKILLLIKHGKKEIVDSTLPDFITESKIVVNETRFNYSVYLNTKKSSKDYLKFLESFGEGSINFANDSTSDTLYRYDVVYNL